MKPKLKILCQIPGCTEPIYDKNLCWLHFLVFKKEQRKLKDDKKVERRFLKK